LYTQERTVRRAFFFCPEAAKQQQKNVMLLDKIRGIMVRGHPKRMTFFIPFFIPFFFLFHPLLPSHVVKGARL
jgi:hypothetical protein